MRYPFHPIQENVRRNRRSGSDYYDQESRVLFALKNWEIYCEMYEEMNFMYVPIKRFVRLRLDKAAKKD